MSSKDNMKLVKCKTQKHHKVFECYFFIDRHAPRCWISNAHMDHFDLMSRKAQYHKDLFEISDLLCHVTCNIPVWFWTIKSKVNLWQIISSCFKALELPTMN